jgi:hypothetical protein
MITDSNSESPVSALWRAILSFDSSENEDFNILKRLKTLELDGCFSSQSPFPIPRSIRTLLWDRSTYQREMRTGMSVSEKKHEVSAEQLRATVVKYINIGKKALVASQAQLDLAISMLVEIASDEKIFAHFFRSLLRNEALIYAQVAEGLNFPRGTLQIYELKIVEFFVECTLNSLFSNLFQENPEEKLLKLWDAVFIDPSNFPFHFLSRALSLTRSQIEVYSREFTAEKIPVNSKNPAFTEKMQNIIRRLSNDVEKELVKPGISAQPSILLDDLIVECLIGRKINLAAEKNKVLTSEKEISLSKRPQILKPKEPINDSFINGNKKDVIEQKSYTPPLEKSISNRKEKNSKQPTYLAKKREEPKDASNNIEPPTARAKESGIKNPQAQRLREENWRKIEKSQNNLTQSTVKTASSTTPRSISSNSRLTSSKGTMPRSGSELSEKDVESGFETTIKNRSENFEKRSEGKDCKKMDLMETQKINSIKKIQSGSLRTSHAGDRRESSSKSPLNKLVSAENSINVIQKKSNSFKRKQNSLDFNLEKISVFLEEQKPTEKKVEVFNTLHIEKILLENECKMNDIIQRGGKVGIEDLMSSKMFFLRLLEKAKAIERLCEESLAMIDEKMKTAKYLELPQKGLKSKLVKGKEGVLSEESSNEYGKNTLGSIPKSRRSRQDRIEQKTSTNVSVNSSSINIVNE